jgi:hypothetical protein
MSARILRARRARLAAPAAAAVLTCVTLDACSGTPATTHVAGGSSTTPSTTATTTTLPSGTTPTSVPPPAGSVVGPGDVDAIVAFDTSVNNRANATLSLSLQDSHETCLQGYTDDLTYKGDMAAGLTNSGPSFEQVPKRALVPRQTGYPATFSALVSDVAPKSSATTVLLTYVRTSASQRWRLSSSASIIGPTAAGVTVPATPTGAGGFVTALDPTGTDGLALAPDAVASKVAAAFTSEAQSGHLPSGVTAQFGKDGAFDPHANAQAIGQLGTITSTFTATPPADVAGMLAGAACTYPSYRIAGGGALVVFPMFETTVLSVKGTAGVTQPANRSQFTPLLAPGTYTRIFTTLLDVGVAIVPPAGSSAPIDVIGQGPAPLSQTGVEGGEITT